MRDGHFLKRGLPAFIAGSLIAAVSARARGLTAAAPLPMALRYLSDGCCVAAILIGGLGLLIWISTTGAFDIFGYGFSSLLTLFTSLRHPKDQPTYLDYKTFRAEKRRPARKELLIVGVIFLILSVLLLMGYYGLKA